MLKFIKQEEAELVNKEEPLGTVNERVIIDYYIIRRLSQRSQVNARTEPGSSSEGGQNYK